MHDAANAHHSHARRRLGGAPEAARPGAWRPLQGSRQSRDPHRFGRRGAGSTSLRAEGHSAFLRVSGRASISTSSGSSPTNWRRRPTRTKPMILPDVNVLVHAHNANSAVHQQARRWWDGCLSGVEGVGLAWATMLGFVRITTNRKVVARPLAVEAVMQRLEDWLALPHVHVATPSDVSFCAASRPTRTSWDCRQSYNGRPSRCPRHRARLCPLFDRF